MKDRAPMFGLTTINNNSWLIGDRAVLSRRSRQPWPDHTPGLISTWTASDQSHYAVLDASIPPAPRPWKPEDDPILVHLTAGGSIPTEARGNNDIAELATKCVYSIGDVFVKMHHTIHCDSADEHVTVKQLEELLPDRTFALPKVLYHARYDDRYFLITSMVPGQTAERLWWDFDDATKDRYAMLIAKACIEVATLTSSKLRTAIDGTTVPNGRFGEALKRKDMPNILANCRTLNFSVEGPFSFFHGDLRPTNVLIDTQKETIGIIDWQAAEYVPREWIDITFTRALAMVQDSPIPDNYQSNDYSQRVWKALQRHGFINGRGLTGMGRRIIDTTRPCRTTELAYETTIR
ncbi:unnamed protein product [Discula destructiva]